MSTNPEKGKRSSTPLRSVAAKKSAASQSSRRRSDRVVQLLAEYERKPKGSEERFQAFRDVLKAVHDEPHG